MTATVTDITEYRNAKRFAKWTDDRLLKRHKLLGFIEQGHTEVTRGPYAKMSFPGGFDPVKHPTENIEAVAAELARRGVNVSSA